MSEIQIRLVEGDEREAALAVEEKIFREEGYPYDYHQFNDQSRVFGAFDGGVCIGALRVVSQTPLVPPVMADCKVWDLQYWQSMGDKFAELATQAVEEKYRHQMVGLMLIRAAYTDARLRGLLAMAVITEPENVEYLNNEVHFACRQIGDIGFKGWQCAPYIHFFDEVETKLAAADPNSFNWFTGDVPDELLAVVRP
ncbi:hypothetical protein KBC99_02110 [Candidatus Saccharibacteria bacterium]|nr:hypothetical protein [Candidatus Saccharibacteria bacterium]